MFYLRDYIWYCRKYCFYTYPWTPERLTGRDIIVSWNWRPTKTNSRAISSQVYFNRKNLFESLWTRIDQTTTQSSPTTRHRITATHLLRGYPLSPLQAVSNHFCYKGRPFKNNWVHPRQLFNVNLILSPLLLCNKSPENNHPSLLCKFRQNWKNCAKFKKWGWESCK